MCQLGEHPSVDPCQGASIERHHPSSAVNQLTVATVLQLRVALTGGRRAGRLGLRWRRRGWRGGGDDPRASACSSAISSGVIVTVSPFTPLSGVFQKWQAAAAECAAHAA